MSSLEAPAPSTPEVSSQSWLSRVRALLRELSEGPAAATLAEFQGEARALNGAAGDCVARLIVPGAPSEADAMVQTLQDALKRARADVGEQGRVAQVLEEMEGPLAQVGMLALLTQSLVARVQSAEAIAQVAEAQLAECTARVRELESAPGSTPPGELVLA